MVKGFDEKQRDYIYNRLMEVGKELFGRYGLKKTSIADLTKEVGIAQGTFYNFFSSKEELFFEILEKEEEKLKEGVIKDILSKPLTRQNFSIFLKESFDAVDKNPIFKWLYFDNEYELLIRKLPKEKVETHIKRDSENLLPLIQYWQEQGVMVKEKPEIIAAVIRSIFIFTLHKKEIGEEIFSDTISCMMDLISKGLIREREI